MKIVDCIIFYNELTLFKLRYLELFPWVDYFVIVEAKKTFTNLNKPLNFNIQKLKEDIPIFDESKIIYYTIDKFPPSNSKLSSQSNAFRNEIYQRNQIKKALLPLNLEDTDVVLISDADEIPNPEVLERIKNNILKINGVFKLVMDVYIYSIYCKILWGRGAISKAISYNLIKNNKYDIEYLVRKYYPMNGFIEFGGWHFTFFGGYDSIIDKLKSWSHTHKSKKALKKPDKLKTKINNQKFITAKDFMKTKIIEPINNPFLPNNYHILLPISYKFEFNKPQQTPSTKNQSLVKQEKIERRKKRIAKKIKKRNEKNKKK